MLSCSRQLQGIFGLLKPVLHVKILIWNVSVCFNDGVISPRATDYVPQISIFCANPCVLDRHRHYTHQSSTEWLMHFELREAKLLIHFKPNFFNITLFHGLSSMLPPHIEVAVNAVPHIESKPNTLQSSNMQTKLLVKVVRNFNKPEFLQVSSNFWQSNTSDKLF